MSVSKSNHSQNTNTFHNSRNLIYFIYDITFPIQTIIER